MSEAGVGQPPDPTSVHLAFEPIKQWEQVDHILRQIDATANDYFLTHHGEQKAADLIDWIMSMPVEDRPEAWAPILERDETGVVVQVKEGECGEGKTHDELKRIAREKPRLR